MLIAKWKTKGNDYLELYDNNTYYSYKGNDCGGILPTGIISSSAAITWMEDNPVKFLKMDRPSLKRVN